MKIIKKFIKKYSIDKESLDDFTFILGFGVITSSLIFLLWLLFSSMDTFFI